MTVYGRFETADDLPDLPARGLAISLFRWQKVQITRRREPGDEREPFGRVLIGVECLLANDLAHTMVHGRPRERPHNLRVQWIWQRSR
jgi:hypothetical protein